MVHEQKYHEPDGQQPFRSDVSDASEEEDSRNAYENVWQPPIQLQSVSQKDEIVSNQKSTKHGFESRGGFDSQIHDQFEYQNINSR